jgi:hypothetical protein
MNWNDSVSLKDLEDLCSRFDIGYRASKIDGLIVYDFGSVQWSIVPPNTLTVSDYFNIGLLLAAKFPDKVKQGV